MTKLEEEIARAIMLSRNEPGCMVKDWQREEIDNPHVAQALRQARAAIAVIEPRDRLAAELAEALRPFCDFAHIEDQIGVMLELNNFRNDEGVSFFALARAALAKWETSHDV